MQERLVTRLSGPDKGWKPAFLNPDKGAGGKQPDLWLIDGELPTSTGAASSLMKSSPLEKGCSRAKISPEEKTSITRCGANEENINRWRKQEIGNLKTQKKNERKHQGNSTRKPECLKSNTMIQTHADIIRVSKVKPKKFVFNHDYVDDDFFFYNKTVLIDQITSSMARVPDLVWQPASLRPDSIASFLYFVSLPLPSQTQANKIRIGTSILSRKGNYSYPGFKQGQRMGQGSLKHFTSVSFQAVVGGINLLRSCPRIKEESQ